MSGPVPLQPSAAKPKRVRGPLRLVICVAAGIGGWLIADFIIDAFDSNGSDNDLAIQTSSNVVETDAFRFVMHEAPTTEPIIQTVEGTTISGSQWRADVDDDAYVQVLALMFPSTPGSPEGVIAQMVGGMIVRTGGQMHDDSTSQDGGALHRRTVISVADGYLFSDMFSKGAWVVSIFGSDSDDVPPSEYVDLVDSFAFA